MVRGTKFIKHVRVRIGAILGQNRRDYRMGWYSYNMWEKFWEAVRFLAILAGPERRQITNNF